ncbi:kinase-like domain-containing protein [Daldinia loculata]|uniref:kinase-like domain-containing protein n=1 Tax=Daldinia loculata TaxID=103429 RepID=UPI0020C47A38|nr:kinase-like domain-containing protein [Daldinia loculata]KAI1644676.1 kinase-like domain-containing protein [Daldinia loculata]
MAPLSQAEKDALVSKVLGELSGTPYACSSLTHLTNGTTNFVFRGKLTHPIRADGGDQSTTTTVIIKHSTEFAAVNKDFPLDPSRAFYEESMLHALSNFPSSTTVVKAPRLHLFIRDANVQVLEDFPAAVDLKNILVSPTANSILTAPVAMSIGYDVGSWLRLFHTWTSSSNAELKAIGDNEPMRKLKYAITYDSFLKVLENNFPDLLEGHRSTLEQVKDTATNEFQKTSRDGDGGEGEHWGLIHGDFWTGNVLLPGNPSLSAEHTSGAKLFIVDWEFAQFGHRAYDIGQMVGDIYERKHFFQTDGAVPAIEGFIQGYGGLEDELAFRTAIHAGVQLIGWYTRRAPTAPLQFPLEKVTDAMRIGRDWILKAWQKDRDYFQSSPLASLFKR